MVEGKDKFALWLTPEAKELVEQAFRQDGCRSRSEFIEKAVCFYCGYLNAERTGDYLPRVMGSVLSGTLDMFARRMGRLMFKQAVECNITNHLIAIDRRPRRELQEKRIAMGHKPDDHEDEKMNQTMS